MPNRLPASSSLASTLTLIMVRRGQEEVTVIMQGDGRFTYRVIPAGRTRLAVDLPDVVSSLSFKVLSVDHPVLKRIRIGRYPEKLRLVFDIIQPVRYAIKSLGNRLVVQMKR